MKRKRRYLSLLITSLLLLTSLSSFVDAAPIRIKTNPSLLNNTWPAYWIAPGNNSPRAFGVYHFRRDFELDQLPKSFIIHVSADNRYRLFVNGQFVCAGPAKADLAHWRYNSVDIAPYVHQGKNVIAATVWNYGRYRALSIQSYRTAFLLQADNPDQSVVNTDKKWKVIKDTSYLVYPIDSKALKAYFAIGPGLKINGAEYPWGWKKVNYDDSSWQNSTQLKHGIPREGNHAGAYEGWQLVPRQIPAMERSKLLFEKIDRVHGIRISHSNFLNGHPITIPANTHATILINQGFETTAFPELKIRGGRGSKIKVTYAEALFDSTGNKGNRDDILGKHIKGYHDVFISDGGVDQVYTTLWWRTYRYVQFDISTSSEPLKISNYYGVFTAYPFKERANFTSNDKNLKQIWDVAWRTVRLCSHETYMDCPYYEQMEYDGDTRIEGLVSMYVSGDDSLSRKAIGMFNDSRLPDGLVQSRYPANGQQIIPPFSLFWVAMIHDYWMYSGDSALVKNMLTPVYGVMDWFQRHLDQNNMLGPLPRWNFVDWSFKNRGVPAGAIKGNSSIITLQYVYALKMAAQMSSVFGYKDEAAHFLSVAGRLKKAVYHFCWDSNRGLLADTPAKKEFSQHANIMAVLDGMFSPKESKTVMQKVLSDTSLIQTSYYYRYYLFQALKKAGMSKDFLPELSPWHHMLNLGLTTFAETPEPTRSDCHGWSSSPVYEFLTLVAGINPKIPGFRKVTIDPHLGNLRWIRASMPTPQGKVDVQLHREGNKMVGKVTLPENVSGSFSWHNHTISLHQGTQDILINR